MNDVGANLFGKNITMNEREDEVKMKMKFKRILVGVMAVATLGIGTQQKRLFEMCR